ncbi:unnamed protein product [Symbiodinium necroappetens]|uniref:PAS domain-containing protein n=1 Tax=Symbiodinium necroappetens TaxID=1628268 RepID=A0A812SKB7_9DINO|nr:unnamed protein product [Symbiodinium necroappetens]
MAISVAAHIKSLSELLHDNMPVDELDPARKEALLEQHMFFSNLLLMGMSVFSLIKCAAAFVSILVGLPGSESMRPLLFSGCVFLLMLSFFQLSYGRLSVARIQLVALLLHLSILLRELHPDLTDDTLVMAFKVTAGLALINHLRALQLQISFLFVKVVYLRSTFTTAMFVDEICAIVLLWVTWFAVQTCQKQFLLMTQKIADAKASLEAVRAMLASQCDAEACLSSGLIFQDPSSKLAHFLGCEKEQLRSRSFDEFLVESDRQRFKSLIGSSVHALALEFDQHQGQASEKPKQHHALAATVTLSGACRQIEVNLRLCCVPAAEFNDRFFLLALNVSQDRVPDFESLDPAAISESESASTEEQELPARTQTDGTGCNLQLQARNKDDNNAFNSVSVIFDSRTLELSDLRVSLGIGSWKRSDRTFLKNCIMEDVWPGVSSWLKAWSQGQASVVPPPIVLFRFPQLFCLRNVLAARQADLKILRGAEGRPTGEVCLRLRNIRLRTMSPPGRKPKRRSSSPSLAGESWCSTGAAILSPPHRKSKANLGKAAREA